VFGLDYFADEQRAHLRRFAIAPSKRGNGHGKYLLSEAIREARLLGAERLSLGVYSSNPVAIRLYEQAGFQVSGERRHNEDSSGLSYIMQLNL
jgi:ribosomal protein S18 acetylase RimI-like enzyme